MRIGRLDLREQVWLDISPLRRALQEFGTDRADLMLGHAVEELAVWLARASRLRAAGEMQQLHDLARQIAEVGGGLGMARMSEVAWQVSALCSAGDPAALAAVTARMVRLGESSVLALWDIHDLSV